MGMTVRKLIEKMSDETFDNEKDYGIEVKDEDGNMYEVVGYDWCNQIILVGKMK